MLFSIFLFSVITVEGQYNVVFYFLFSVITVEGQSNVVFYFYFQ
jgi:hypothetical protein